MRKWSVSVFILDEDGEQHPADCFQRVVFNLHPSFENPTQSMYMPLRFSIASLANSVQRSPRPLSPVRM